MIDVDPAASALLSCWPTVYVVNIARMPAFPAIVVSKNGWPDAMMIPAAPPACALLARAVDPHGEVLVPAGAQSTRTTFPVTLPAGNAVQPVVSVAT